MVQQVSQLFLHLSDVHFGQEVGGRLHVHNDVKEMLIDDVRRVVQDELDRSISGIIVSGDIAYSGSEEEYQDAGKWLDRVAEAGGCKDTDVHVVPGNHDINRDKISGSAGWMLEKIKKNGEAALDEILANERDCEVLYDRLADYRSFAQGYGCPLDMAGGHAGDAFSFELTDGRKARFLGLNSALACGAGDGEGNLILGAKQRVISERPDEELIVICHHPLNWFNDAVDAWKYLRRSASVFISGHEHTSAVELRSEEGHSDILMIASGATVPPAAEDGYNFQYNFLEFGWDFGEDCLSVVVRSRCWDDASKRFTRNPEQGKPEGDTFCVTGEKEGQSVGSPYASTVQEDEGQVTPDTPAEAEGVLLEMVDISASITLRFFRDLTADQRRKILVQEGLLPADWSGVLTHSIETLLFRQLLSRGNTEALEKTIAEKLKNNGERG